MPDYRRQLAVPAYSDGRLQVSTAIRALRKRAGVHLPDAAQRIDVR
jgi:hypothetical protein